MTAQEMKGTEKVVQLRKGVQTRKMSVQKWGGKVLDVGFCIVPSLLLRAQARLGLNPTQLAVILQLCDYWWDNDRKPYPSKKALSERLGLGGRQIQRYLAELEQAGLIRRIERRAGHGGKLSNRYDLGGLVDRLKELEPEFREAEKAAREERLAVSRRGHGLRRNVNAPAGKN